MYEKSKKCADITNNPGACYYVFYLGLELNKLKKKEAYEYLIRSFENNYLDAQLYLGYYYYSESEPSFVKRDYQKSFEIFSNEELY